MKAVKVNDILIEVKQLGKEEQFDLLEKLVLLIHKKEIKKDSNLKLSSIAGIVEEIWQDIDIDKYIQSEREW